MTQSLLVRQYQATLAKYRKFTRRLNKRIQNNTLEELSRRKRNQLLRTIDRLKRQLESLQLNLKHAGIAVGMGLSLALATPAIAQQPNPVGSEFKVNTYTNSYQQQPAVAMDDDGDYVVVWHGNAGYGFNDILGQRYNSLGQPQGSQFLINSNTDSSQPSDVAMDSDGDFVVVWERYFGATLRDEIRGQRYSSDGTQLGTEFSINTYTTLNQQNPAVAMDSNGNFVVVWETYGQDNTSYEVYAQRYDNTGAAQGLEFRVNTNVVNDQRFPSVSMDDTGNFVVVWKDLTNSRIYGQRYDNTGAVQGGEFLVPTSVPTGFTYDPDVAMDADGDFVISWTQYTYPGNLNDIDAVRYNKDGVIQGTQFTVNTFYQTNNQGKPAVSVDDDGDFVITWQSQGQDGSYYGIYAKRYDASGSAYGGEFKVNTYTTQTQILPAVASDANGEFVITWESQGQDGSGGGIYAQRFTVVPPPDAVGSEFLVPTTTTFNETQAAVAVDDNGDYVVVWYGYTVADFYSIYGQRYFANGSPKGSQFRVNTTTFISNDLLDVAMDADGDFVVVWEYNNFDFRGQLFNKDGTTNGTEFIIPNDTGPENRLPSVAMDASGNFVVTWEKDVGANGFDIIAQRYDNTGAELGGEFTVNTSAGNNQLLADVALDADGDFVVVWQSYLGGPYNSYEIYAQRYDALGSAQGSEIQVSTPTSYDQTNPGVAIDSDGDFVITWQRDVLAGIPTEYNIYAQRYDNTGTVVGSEFQVNTTVFSSQRNPSISMEAGGDFVITWEDTGQADGDGFGVFGQRFDNTGKFQGPEFVVNDNTGGSQSLPAISLDADGDFIVAWQSYSQDSPSTWGIYAKQYTTQADPISSVAEFQVNTFTTNYQRNPDVATDSDGDFIVVWQSYGQQAFEDIYGQRYTKDGTPQGLEFQINTVTDNGQRDPAVAMDQSGNFIVVWESYGQDTGSSFGIVAQPFNSSGSPVGSESIANSIVAGNQQNPDVAMDADGNFVMVWESPDGDNAGIYVRRFDNTGTPQGAETLVNSSYITSVQNGPAVAVDSDGDFVVVWQSNFQDGNFYGIYAQRYNSSGVKQGTEFKVNTYTTGYQIEPSVAMNDDGDFVITWNSNGQDGSAGGIYAQFYSAVGGAMAGEFRVNDYTTSIQDNPDVFADADGDFIIVWESYQQDGSVDGIYGKRYNSNGQPQGGEFQVNDTTLNNQRSPSISLDNDGDYVVAWTSFGQDGNGDGIFAKGFISANPSEAPVILTNTGVTCNEGSSANISASELDASDVDDTDDKITYTITAVPANGTLEFNAVALQVGDTFTQQQFGAIINIVYIHDGSETTSDSFEFTVTDGNTTLPAETFNIAINPINDPPSLDMNEPLSVAEGGTGTIITPDNLLATDPDDIDTDLIYEVTAIPGNGELRLSGTALNNNDSFSQDDLMNTLVTYVHDGSHVANDFFDFTLSDATTTLAGTEVFTINVSLTDDQPIIQANLGITVTEGDFNIIQTTQLNTTDEESASDIVTYTLTTLPVNGSLQLNDVDLQLNETFTQADIDGNLVKYQHDASQTSSDSFGFSVSDGTNDITTQTFNITISDVDNPPTIDTNAGLTINEGDVGIVNTNVLNTTDVDDPSTSISYTLTAAPANGILILDGTQIGVGDSFTQSQVDADLLTYEHDGGETDVDSFNFTVGDGNTDLAETSFTISVTPVNDEPVLETNTGITTLNEGASFTITTTELSSSDVDNADDQIFYNVNVPANGTLVRGSTTLVDGDEFTEQDIISGLVEYTHDGSNTTSDEFTFGVSNDATAAVGTQTFSIAITPIDNPPQIVANTGFTLGEGTGKTITTTELSANDENAATDIIFTITTLPANGEITNDGNSLPTASPTFTQDDLVNDRIRYQHDGSETNSDLFSFSVSDGTQSSDQFDFNIAVTPVNDPPVLETNIAADVALNGTVTISSSLLRSTDVDNTVAEIIYTVKAPVPQSGVLRNGTTAVAVDNTFTQADIDGNQITYQNNVAASGDSFNFTVSDGTDELSAATFAINIGGGGANNPPTAITLSNTVIQSSATVGDLVGELETEDEDPADDHTYVILSGNDDFQLGTGAAEDELQLARELTAGNYQVQIQSTDDNGASISTTFTISVISPVTAGTLDTQNIISFGTTTENFRVISIPFENVQVPDVFPQLNSDDFGVNWKIVRFNTSTSTAVDVNATATFQPGQGYWFLSFDPTTIQLPAGSIPVSLNDNNGFVFSLQSGWNLIGNPFLDDLEWDTQISNGLAASDFTSNDLANGGNVYVYVGGTYSFTDQTLEIFQGGFVKVENSINVEAASPTVQSGRRDLNNLPKHSSYVTGLDDWQLLLQLENGNIISDLAGVGMHPLGDEGIDFHDVENPPSIGGNVLFQLSEKSTGLAKNIIPGSTGHVWDYNFYTSKSETRLTWDEGVARQLDQPIYLLIPSQNKFIDMKQVGSVTLDPTITEIQIAFGSLDDQEIKGLFTNLYPNPTDGDLSVEVLNFDEDLFGEVMQFELYTLDGKLKFETPFEALRSGTSLSLDNEGLTSGVYLYRIKSTKYHTTPQKLIIKR